MTLARQAATAVALLVGFAVVGGATSWALGWMVARWLA